MTVRSCERLVNCDLFVVYRKYSSDVLYGFNRGECLDFHKYIVIMNVSCGKTFFNVFPGQSRALSGNLSCKFPTLHCNVVLENYFLK